MSDYKTDSMIGNQHAFGGSESATSLLQEPGGRVPGLRITSPRTQFDWDWKDLLPGSATIGSSPECDICLPVPGVAPRHCVLIVGTQRTLLQALSPRTWINDGVATESHLKPGDRLIVGPVELHIAAIPVRESSRPQPQPISPQHLQELLASSQSITRTTPPTLKQADGRRGAAQFTSEHVLSAREDILDELLAEIQSALDQVLQREKDHRKEASRDRLVLQQRARELDGQFAHLEEMRSKIEKEKNQLAAVEELARQNEFRSKELHQLEAILDARHEELGQRTQSLINEHRKIREAKKDLESREASLRTAPSAEEVQSFRAALARNRAQLRHLDHLEKELIRRDELIQKEAVRISTEKARLAQLNRQLEEEKRDWAEKCKTRERFLEQLEAGLNSRQEGLDSGERDLIALRTELSSTQQTLEHLKQELEERAEAIDQNTQDLEQRNLQLAELQDQLKSQQGDVEASRKEIEATRNEQAALAADLNAQRSDLAQREEALIARELEIRNREESKLAEIQQREQELEESRAQFLSSQQADKEAALKEVEERKSELDLRAEELRHREEALAARELEIRNREESKLAEIQQREQELEESREQLQKELNEVDAERQNFQRLRAELDAERQRDTYDREQLHVRLKQLEIQQAEIDHRHQILEEARTELQRQQEEWHATRDSTASLVAQQGLELEELESQRQKLNDDCRLLSDSREELDQMRDALGRREAEVDASSQRIQKEQESLQILERQIQEGRERFEEQLNELKLQQERIEADRTELQQSQLELEERLQQLDQREQLLLEREEFLNSQPAPSQNVNENDSRDTDSETPLLPIQTEEQQDVLSGDEQSEQDSDTHNPEPDDETAARLRKELASLFGMSLSEPSEKSSGETPEVESDQRTSSLEETLEHRDANRTEEDEASHEVLRLESPRPASVRSPEESKTPPTMAGGFSTSSEGNDEEISVEDYMQRLLARTRSREQGHTSSEHNKESSPTKSASSQVSIPLKIATPTEENSSVESEVTPQKEPPVRKRKLDDLERTAIRENLHSFRQVANQSARTAVAKSTFQKKSTLLRNMVIVNLIGWVATLGLVAAATLLNRDLSTEVFTVGSISGLLTLLCFVRYKEIRRMNLKRPSESPRTAKTEQKSDSDGADSPPKGPLSFL